MDINDYRIKLEFTIEEMNMIFRFLGTIPYDQVWGLMDNLKQQVDKQLVPPENFESDGTEHPL